MTDRTEPRQGNGGEGFERCHGDARRAAPGALDAHGHGAIAAHLSSHAWLCDVRAATPTGNSE